MKGIRRLVFILAAYFLAAPNMARAQIFPLPDLGGKSGKDSALPAGLGDLFGQVKDLAGGQSASEEARSGDAIAATVFGAARPWRNG